ncbi:MAG: Crp/Fnr family transcriptional regulator [Rhizobacter sp.]|nr:Crp/Fnr family transcriptional regulator [Ferruginibacter sp.]
MIDKALKLLIERVYPLGDQEISALQSMFTSKKVDKNCFVLKEGQQTQSLFFLKSGIYRGYYVKDIDEITFNFFFGPTFYADTAGILENKPTLQNICALEAGEIWEANIREVESLGDQYPSILKLFIRFYEMIFAHNQKRQLSFIYESAEERYRNLFNLRPRVVSEIPLIYIASYLGIKPESLSRIRRKIATS